MSARVVLTVAVLLCTPIGAAVLGMLAVVGVRRHVRRPLGRGPRWLLVALTAGALVVGWCLTGPTATLVLLGGVGLAGAALAAEHDR